MKRDRERVHERVQVMKDNLRQPMSACDTSDKLLPKTARSPRRINFQQHLPSSSITLDSLNRNHTSLCIMSDVDRIPDNASTCSTSSISDDHDGAIIDGDAKRPINEAFKSTLERFRHTSSSRSTVAPKRVSIDTVTKANLKRPLPTKEDSPGTARSVSSSPAKRQRTSTQYAPPSKYAHLAPLTDVLEPNLICVFVGFNPGIMTATSGHAYAHPSNMFWKLLHSSGCTDIRLRPEQDVDLPRLYSMGNTNIVARPSRHAAELSKAESAAGTPVLEEKIRAFRPEAVCIVGKGIWESIWRWRHQRAIRKDEFQYGWQKESDRIGKTADWPGAAVFVATATSGLAANTKPHEKEAIWLPFGQWVKRRRQERADSKL